MWLQLSQVLKKITEGNGRKPAFIFYAGVTKIQKTRMVQALRASLHLLMGMVAENLRFIFRSRGIILTVISVISGHLSKEKLERLSFLPITGSFLRIT